MSTGNLVSFSICEVSPKTKAAEQVLNNVSMSLYEFIEKELTTPQPGPKDGRYFVRGPSKTAGLTRSDKSLNHAELLILDGDSSLNIETGEITNGCPEPKLIHGILQGMGINHVVYTSHSHGESGLNKCRVVLPCYIADKATLKATVDTLVSWLRKCRVNLSSPAENYRWSQPWYLPRLRTKDTEYLLFSNTNGHDLEAVRPDLVTKPQCQAGVEKQKADVKGDSLIEQYNLVHGNPESMLKRLEENGYALQQGSTGEKSNMHYRLLAPGSTTHNAGCNLFLTESGKWKVYSHHGGHCSISADGANEAGRACDAFDLYRIFEHGGEINAAIRAIGADKQISLDDSKAYMPDQAMVLQEQPRAADPCSDVQNAYRFWALAKDDMMFVHGIGWHKWNGLCWELDPHEAIRIGNRIGTAVADEVKPLLDDYQSEADKAARETILSKINKLYRHVKYSESKGAIESAIKLASSIKPVSTELLNTNPWLFNCANGTLDLKTGQLRKPDRSDNLTKSTSIEYDPNANCVQWLTALVEIFDNNYYIVKFIQRVFGYCLTGCVTEQVLFVFFGEGANGKDVILGRIRTLMGEYAGEVAPGLLVQSRNEQHPTGIYDLRGKRMGISSETGEGKPLDETLTKQLTGGERLKARGMRQDFIEFRNEVKIILMTNHLPKIKGDDHAMWRRIRLIPFNRIFKDDERDEKLGQKIDATELPGILKWCVDGCMEWQQSGLSPPNEVLQATAGYRSDQDVLRDFFEQECEFGPTKQATAKDIWKRWRAFCLEINENPGSQKWLAPRVERKGCTKKRNSSGIVYIGIGLKPSTRMHDV